jgi:hypothetical protein
MPIKIAAQHLLILNEYCTNLFYGIIGSNKQNPKSELFTVALFPSI